MSGEAIVLGVQVRRRASIARTGQSSERILTRLLIDAQTERRNPRGAVPRPGPRPAAKSVAMDVTPKRAASASHLDGRCPGLAVARQAERPDPAGAIPPRRISPVAQLVCLGAVSEVAPHSTGGTKIAKRWAGAGRAATTFRPAMYDLAFPACGAGGARLTLQQW
jgi:hypothetical protein